MRETFLSQVWVARGSPVMGSWGRFTRHCSCCTDPPGYGVVNSPQEPLTQPTGLQFCSQQGAGGMGGGGGQGGSRWAPRRGCDRIVVAFAVGRLRRFSRPSRAMWKIMNTPASQGVCPTLISAARPFPEAVAATRIPDQMIKQQSDWRLQCMAIDVPFCAFQGRCQRFQIWGRW